MNSGLDRKSVLQWQQEGVLLVEDGNHGENRPRKDEFGDQGMAFIRAADMAEGRVLFDTAQKINEIAQARVRKGVGQPGDILISHKGTIGRVARAPNVCPPFVCSPQTTFWRVLDHRRLDPAFLYVLLRSPQFQGEFAVRSGETDMAGYVSLTSQRALELSLPPIEEQQAIAEVLGALDDKIELNRRTNRTLEAMARALFRSWFVDFDPVHAKSEGRVPAHMDPATAALFPDCFGDDGLPEGWLAGKVVDLLVLQRGFDLPVNRRTPGPYPVIGAGGHHGMHSEFKVKGPGVTTGRSGVLGAVYFVHEDFWPLNTSLWVKEFPRSSPYYAYFLLQELDVTAINSGSAVPSLNRNYVHSLPATVPPKPIVDSLDRLVSRLFALQRLNDENSKALAALRDTLLPKLMSGELRGREAERALAEVA